MDGFLSQVSQRGRAGTVRAALALLPLLLAACGGGGGDSGGNSGGTAPPISLVVNGTAATGAAMAAAQVELKCAAGSGAGTTQADGTFSVSISGGSLPCVLRVTASGGTVLHSVAFGSGSNARANLTPVTELIVARLVGGEPASFFASFDAAAITDSAVASAQAQVAAILKAAGIDFSALGDLVTSALAARTATAAGDAYDQALDSLAAALADSGNTLAGLRSAVIASSSGATSVASLPPELLLKRAAPTCSALRSTSYRIISPTSGATINEQTGTLSFDAATLTGTRSDGSTANWTANGACRFTEQGTDYSADVVVSRAGVIVGSLTRNGAARDFFGFPVQAHVLADLAGTWNVLGMTRAGSAYTGTAGTTTLNAEGRFVAGSTCQNDATWAIDVCTSVPDAVLALIPPFTAAADGGFTIVDATGATTSRLFAYKAGSGDLMLAVVNNEGGFGFYTPDKPVAPPAVGTAIRNWNFDSNAQFVPYPVYETMSTVTSIDAAAESWTRTQRTVGATREYTTTLFANNPRRGYVHRAAAVVTASDGTLIQLNEFSFLRLHGMGFAPVLLPRPKTFEFSVGQP